jgi:hypothetical protein
MSLFAKISGWLKNGTPVEKGIADTIGHFAMGDTKGGVTCLLAMVETESESHPAVVAALQQIQTTLATAGLASPPVAAVVAKPAVAAAATAAPAAIQPASAAVTPAAAAVAGS